VIFLLGLVIVEVYSYVNMQEYKTIIVEGSLGSEQKV